MYLLFPASPFNPFLEADSKLAQLSNTLKNGFRTPLYIWRIMLAIVALCFCNDGIAEETHERKIQITAGYLYHFAQFTEWANRPAVFHYCVYDDTEVTALLRESYTDKSDIEVKDIDINSQVDDCQLIYVSNSAPAEFFKKIHKLAILSVGTQQDFIQLGGIIYLYENNQKLRFYINNIAAKNAGLKISSQLLQLSREP